MVVNVEKRCKASHSEFQEIWPGLKRCMVCGFALATEDSKERSDEPGKENKPKYPKEDTLHSTYHGKFYKAKNQYGYSNVLDYKVLKAKEETLEDSLKQIKNYDISHDFEKFIEFFETMTSVLKEVRKWTDEFKDNTDSSSRMLYESVRGNINNIRAYCRKGMKATDISEVVPISEEILPIYREMFSSIQNVISTKSCGMIKDYENVPNPVFTFDMDSVYDSFELFMQIVPTKMNKVNGILNDLYTVEFTKSLRLWDMCKPHPRFEHYAVLLWNTPKFLAFIKPYMTASQFESYVEKNKANRQLIDFKFDEAPFYFGRVSLSTACEDKKANKLCDGNCEKCPFGWIDLTYMDKLAEVSDDEDDISDGFENSKEYAQFAQAMTALGQVLNK